MIKLHGAYSGDEVWINPLYIRTLYRADNKERRGNSIMYLVGDERGTNLRETPEQILDLIKETKA